MYCENCGKSILKKSKFCDYCGKNTNIKEVSKQKRKFPSHYVYALVILLVGFGYIGTNLYFKFQDNKLKQQEAKQKMEAQNKADEQKEQNSQSLNSCLAFADTSYSEFWNSECKSLGRKDDCVLPEYNADRADQIKQDDKNECYKMYPQR